MPAVQAERLVWLRVAHCAAAARAGVYLGSHSLRHFAFPPGFMMFTAFSLEGLAVGTIALHVAPQPLSSVEDRASAVEIGPGPSLACLLANTARRLLVGAAG